MIKEQHILNAQTLALYKVVFLFMHIQFVIFHMLPYKLWSEEHIDSPSTIASVSYPTMTIPNRLPYRGKFRWAK